MTSVAPAPVNRSMALAMIDEAKRMGYASGALGLRGRPDALQQEDVEHEGQTVRIQPVVSSLAARVALAEAGDVDWLVLVTDRDDQDLGAGILAHLAWHRLRSPDPWEAVRHRFNATGIDPALTNVPDSRSIASGILVATPPLGWQAAPAGVLTRTHALGSVASHHLGLEGAADLAGVLRWSLRPDIATRLASLRASAGNQLVDSVLDWLASQTGAPAPAVRALLAQSQTSDLVPLGIAIHVLTVATSTGIEHQAASYGFVRLEARWGSRAVAPAALAPWGAAAAALVSELADDDRHDAQVAAIVDRAERLLTDLQAESLAATSDLLPAGRRTRIRRLASALAAAIDSAHDDTSVHAVEATFDALRAHRFLGPDARVVGPAHAAVRLVRWLAGARTAPAENAPTLHDLVRLQVDDRSWADAAINEAAVGVADPDLANGIRLVVRAALERRRAQEREFAAALATATAADHPSFGEGVWPVERLLPEVILPLARTAPVLLLVMDGMSTGVSTTILRDAVERLGWVEAGLPGTTSGKRSAALAVLPSLTEVSRASLLAGGLTRGQQATERADFETVTTSVGKITGALFHKKGVDTTEAGFAVNADLDRALSDKEINLVAVVLNTVDDALDRSDPAGTTWTADAVKHLEPLLAQARAAQRTVVMTADHGHVVERRETTQRSVDGATSARSRPATSPAQEGEVLVRGPRVLTEDGSAVLAVDENVRYTPLKAGYHGGASAAEVVVPLAVLLPDEGTNPAGLNLLTPQVPAWWLTAAARPDDSPELATKAPTKGRRKADPDVPTLFDDIAPVPASGPSLGATVTHSSTYKTQRKLAGRVLVTDDKIAALIDALDRADAGRLPMPMVAQSLGVPETRLPGALAQIRQLLNVEGYAVLSTDARTRAVALDEGLLREQFEVPR